MIYFLGPSDTTSSGSTRNGNEGTDGSSSPITNPMATPTSSTPPPGSGPPSNTGSNTGGVVAGVIIAILVIIATIVTVVVVLYCLRKREHKAYIAFHNLVTSRGMGGGTLEKKIDDVELAGTGNAVYTVVDDRSVKGKQPSKKGQKPTAAGGSQEYEVIDSKPGYEDMDVIAVPQSRYEKTGESRLAGAGAGRSRSMGQRPRGSRGDNYDTLWETKGAGDNDPSHTYSTLQHGDEPGGGGGVTQADNPIYSNPDDPTSGIALARRQTSPPAVYAEVDMTKKKRTPPKPPRAASRHGQHAPKPQQEAEYASSPAVPQKSTELLKELDTKAEPNSSPSSLVPAPQRETTPTTAAGVGEDVYSEPVLTASTKLTTLTKSAISSKALIDNSLYASTDDRSRGEGQFEDEEAIYAMPGPAVIPESNPSGDIYEQTYSAPSLAPSKFLKESSPDVDDSEPDDLCPYSSIYTIPVVQSGEKPLEVTPENIEIIKTLGSGNFGEVLLAKTVGLSCQQLKISTSPAKGNVSSSTDTSVQVCVAIKTLKKDANFETRALFQKESLFMSRLSHPNVVSLLGVCMVNKPFLMMEYMENGDLNQFLCQYERAIQAGAPKEDEIAVSTLVSLCTQVASAMQYLTSKNFVHRDLASRNILVGADFHVKIADFGMSRSLYDSHYYIIKGHAILPIRWMATECFYGRFSAKTDVWAFGVTMWEIFTLAKLEPYHKMEDRELVHDAIRGNERTILSRPEACPEEVYEIMRSCWPHEAKDRATFEQLHEKLSAL